MSRAWNPIFGVVLTDWFRWFAWRPVNTEDRGWRWLRFVWRRRCMKKPFLEGPDFRWWQHVVTHPEPTTRRPT